MRHTEKKGRKLEHRTGKMDPELERHFGKTKRKLGHHIEKTEQRMEHRTEPMDCFPKVPRKNLMELTGLVRRIGQKELIEQIMSTVRRHLHRKHQAGSWRGADLAVPNCQQLLVDRIATMVLGKEHRTETMVAVVQGIPRELHIPETVSQLQFRCQQGLQQVHLGPVRCCNPLN